MTDTVPNRGGGIPRRAPRVPYRGRSSNAFKPENPNRSNFKSTPIPSTMRSTPKALSSVQFKSFFSYKRAINSITRNKPIFPIRFHSHADVHKYALTWRVCASRQRQLLNCVDELLTEHQERVFSELRPTGTLRCWRREQWMLMYHLETVQVLILLFY